jgi:hypothetical protein
MKNNWLLSNQRNLAGIRRMLIEMEYTPILQDYPLKTMQSLFNGFEAEVNRLQREVEKLSIENNKLKKEIKEKQPEDEIKDA